MASADGQTTTHLIEQLEKNPFEFDFYRAVRLLQCAHPEFPRVGYSESPLQDPVRFGQNPSLAFAPSTIESVQRSAGNAVPRMFIHYFGLLGPNGPLPLHLTEYARERQRHVRDNTFTAFLNVFNHRLTSLFFRAWADAQKVLDLDRPGDQRFALYLGSVFGLGMESLQNRDEVPDWAKLYFAGRMSNCSRNAEGLQAILQDFFGLKTEIQTMVGRWLDLPADCVCKLGDSPETGSLGLTAIVGSRFWDCQLTFRIRFGPMDLVDLERLLPVGDAFKRLRDWVRNYVGEEFFWDVQFVLRAAEVPSIALGQSGRLGWTTWLKTAPFKEDAADLILIPPNN
jgi:type VI secretion system protein ImpH